MNNKGHQTLHQLPGQVNMINCPQCGSHSIHTNTQRMHGWNLRGRTITMWRQNAVQVNMTCLQCGHTAMHIANSPKPPTGLMPGGAMLRV